MYLFVPPGHSDAIRLLLSKGVPHYYRMDLLSRVVTAFSLGYRAGTTISGLKVEPSVSGHRDGTKEGPLVPVGVTNRD